MTRVSDVPSEGLEDQKPSGIHLRVLNVAHGRKCIFSAEDRRSLVCSTAEQPRDNFQRLHENRFRYASNGARGLLGTGLIANGHQNVRLEDGFREACTL